MEQKWMLRGGKVVEGQITRFAPEFRGCVLARSISPPAALERWNPNLIGGDILGGAMNLRQLLSRPTPSLYRTPGRASISAEHPRHPVEAFTEWPGITLL
jgi:phytoene dehydrogenase-like protein